MTPSGQAGLTATTGGLGVPSRVSVAPPQVAWQVRALIAGVILTTVAIFVLTSNAFASAIPLVLVLVAYLFFTLPVRIPFQILVFLCAVGDSERLGGGNGQYWQPPQYPLYPLLFENLNKTIPIQALSFRFVEAMFILFGALIVARILFRIKVDEVGNGKTTVALTWVAVAALIGALVMLVWGIAIRGGNPQQGYYQARQLLWMPILTLGGMYCIRDLRDFNRIINWWMVAACIKIAIVAHLHFVLLAGTGLEPAFLTTHTDSILFIVCLTALLSRFLHRATWKNLGLLLVIGAWIILGVTINNRRLAFVNLGICAFIMVVMLRGPVKRSLNKLMVVIVPLLVVYVVIGQKSNSQVFAPARQIMSVVTQKDASSATRDIENYNLLYTLKQGQILGQGFGHMYIELVQAFDISRVFEQYRYMAHNSVLWMWSLGGVVCFTLIWMPVSVGIFLGRRAYLHARTPTERSTAAIAICMIVIWVMQAWGDLGLHQLNAALTLVIALTMCAKLAVATGAMPVRMRLLRHDPRSNIPQTTVDLPSITP